MQITLSGILIVDNTDISKLEHVLLLYRPDKQHYELAGGKVEEGETLEEAALREVKEELGEAPALLEYHKKIVFEHDNKTIESNIFLGYLNPAKQYQPKEETFTSAEWIPIKNYQQYPLAPNVKQFLDELCG